MQRTIVAASIVLGGVIALHAQESTVKTERKVSGEGGTIVTYTGCVQTGPSRTFQLNQVVPVAKSTEVSREGNVVTTTTTYELVPSAQIELQGFVGHKVEVTGMMMPGGESTTRSKTTVEGKHDTTVTEETRTKGESPQFRVTSIKELAEACR